MMTVTAGAYKESCHVPATRMIGTLKRAMECSRVVSLTLDGDELDVVLTALQSFAVDKGEPKDQHPAIDNAIKVFELAATTPHKDLTTGQRKLLKLIEQTYHI